jgi:hypothetical protein
LLGVHAPADMSFLLRVEWRDGKLTIVEGSGPGETVPLERDRAASFVVAPGFRRSGEPVVFLRRADGTVTSMLIGVLGSLMRLDPVS